MFDLVFDSERLAALRATGLLGGGVQEGFTRLTRLAAGRLGASAAYITVLDDSHQEIVGSSDVDPAPPVPLTLSLCRYVVEMERPLAVDDAHADPMISHDESVRVLGIRAYAGVPFRSPSGHVLGAVCAVEPTSHAWSQEAIGILEDVAALATTELRLRMAEAEVVEHRSQAAATVKIALDAIVTMDDRGRILEFNPAAERLFGHSRADALGADLAALLIPARHRQRHGEGFSRHMATRAHTIIGKRTEVEAMRADGSVIPVELTITRSDGELGTRFTGFLRDLSQMRAAQAQATHLALHDDLTGLANRRQLMADVERATANAGPDGPLALLTLDLDDFKTVNDSLGHAGGDVVLREVARRLQVVAERNDLILGRQHGAGFVLLAEGLSGEPAADARRLAGEVLSTFDAPFHQAALEFSLAATIGVALHPQDGATFGDLVRQAESAMYRAKQISRGSVGFTRPAEPSVARARLTMTARLRRALARDELVLHYQPIFAIPDPRPVAMEALIRWQDPERGLIYPDDFIGAAESSGMIVEIGAWVADAACRQIGAWGAEGLTPTVSFNVSPLQLRNGDLVAILRDACARHGADPSRTVIEITESVAMDDLEQTQAILRDLAGTGASVVIDDFGAGHSSLTRLRHLPVSSLKIDRALTRDIETDPGAATVVSATLALAGALGISTVAEGVETDGQLALLVAQGCEFAQGFGLARPMPADQATALLREAEAAAAGRRRWRRRSPAPAVIPFTSA